MVPVKIIVIYGENNVLGTICIDIYQFWIYGQGSTWFILHFEIIIHENGNITRT